MKSYGEWIFEYTSKGLPRDTPPPAGYERYEDWLLRMRGIPKISGIAPDPQPSPPNQPPKHLAARPLRPEI